MSIYVEEFKNNSDILERYGADPTALEGANVLLAWYGYGSYCGSSLVIFERDGKLYEVNGSHCSCYGLEGQWLPEETSWEALSMRNYMQNDYYENGWDKAHFELKKLIETNISKEKDSK